MKKNWTPEEDQILKDNIFKVKKTNDLAKLLPLRSSSAIYSRIALLKMDKPKTKEYHKNENFFSEPNTVNSSVAGIISSDGHLSYKKYSHKIQFGIHTKDRKMLEDINSAMDSDYIIKDTVSNKVFNDKRNNKKYPYLYYRTELHIGKAKKLHEDLLKNWNIPTGKKSLILEPPVNLNDMDCCLAYISGIITGDGSIFPTLMDGTKNHVKINLVGTLKMMEWCRLIFSKCLKRDIKTKIQKKPNENVHFFGVTGWKAMLLIEKINTLKCVKLDRKWLHPEVMDIINGYKKLRPDVFKSFFEDYENFNYNIVAKNRYKDMTYA